MIYRITNEDELYHYGVKGMKWGVRKEPYADRGNTRSLINDAKKAERSADNARSDYKKAKAASRSANKEYSKAFDKAYNFSNRHPITQYIKKSKNYKKSNDLWGEVHDKVKATKVAKVNKKTARARMKVANKASRQAYYKAMDYKKFSSPKDLGQAWSSQIDVYKATYKAAKNATGAKKKAKAALNAYANTPYREIGLFGTYNTSVKRKMTGNW